MKKIITKYSAWIILAAMFALLVPGISMRINSENKNKNITISILYNDIKNKVSAKKLSQVITEYKDEGVDTISILEDDINSLVSRGEVTCIKYNVLCHKYDDESMRVATAIAKNCPDVTYDSYILMAKKKHTREKLSYMLPRKFSDTEYAFAGELENMDVYILYDGRKELWDYAVGYDEKVIEELSEQGLKIALVYKVKNYSKLDYLKDIDRIVKKYNVKYLNIKEDSYEPDKADIIEENYKGIAKIINENDMTLVVTENTNQLSNQKCMGYAHIFDETMKDGGSKKVVRSYETYDDSQADETHYEYRATQYLNSTIDRNIRFVTVTQIAEKKLSYDECADYTFKAVTQYKDKIEKLGFTVNEDTQVLDYTANRKLNSAACAVIMVMCALLILQMLTERESFAITMAAICISALAFLGTFVLPDTLLSLYPSMYCVFQSCFAMTAVLYFVKKHKSKMPFALLLLSSVALMVASLLIGAVGMGTMLSGIGYYVNNEIFRGIKLSLMVPVFYTAVVFYFMFIKNERSGMMKDIKKLLYSDIKVYWVILGGIVLAAGVYYIIRSGNVNEISSLEQAMRNAITEIFPARPRTKEFLIGYPALVLFVYYMKYTDVKIVKWLLAVGSSILAASVTNSFCHVFTNFTVIVMRTFNALLLGVIVAAAAFIANIILIKILKKVKEKF